MSQPIATTAALMAAAALRTKVVTLNTAIVMIRELSIAGRAEFLAEHHEDSQRGVACLLRLGVIGEDGQPLLDADAARDLIASSGGFVQALAKEIVNISGLGETPASD